MPDQGPDRSAIIFRPIQTDDEAFLCQLYATTREDVDAMDWDEAQKRTFVEMQFRAQHTHYQEHYKGASFDLILLTGTPIGRLYIHQQPTDIRIMDIALLPPYRNTGIGTLLLKEILELGAKTQRPVSIHVEQYNPAMNLYKRLGFVFLEEHGIYHLMECKPPPAENDS